MSAEYLTSLACATLWSFRMQLWQGQRMSHTSNPLTLSRLWRIPTICAGFFPATQLWKRQRTSWKSFGVAMSWFTLVMSCSVSRVRTYQKSDVCRCSSMAMRERLTKRVLCFWYQFSHALGMDHVTEALIKLWLILKKIWKKQASQSTFSELDSRADFCVLWHPRPGLGMFTGVCQKHVRLIVST